MKLSEWFKQVAVLQLRWPQSDIKKESATLWFTDLEEFPTPQVEAAIVALYRDGREWAPNGAQIRNKIIELRTDTPDWSAAYEMAMKARLHGGWYSGKAWLKEQSPLVLQAVETFGWDSFWLDGDTGDGTRRAQFREIFTNLAKRVERDERYLGLEAVGFEGLPEKAAGPKRFGQIIQLPKGDESA